MPRFFPFSNRYGTGELARKIKEELSCRSLDDLEPLEMATVDKTKAIIDNVSNTWGKGNGYKPTAGKNVSTMVNGISGKW